MESWIFLGVILLIAFVAKNQSLLIATLAVLFLKLLPHSDKILTTLNQRGINWGVTLISATILVPIATGDIVLKDLLDTLKSPLGWVATICGVLVAVLSSKGVGLINQSPEVTVALVFGTIMGVVFLKGIAAGPVIAAGMTYCIMQVVQIVMNR
ncbi:DUF441 domain-containing protein [Enterococcus hermanniensis]|uniref:UPF0756 membrane protein RV04_GL000258 n=1 Tax=Enterococcus hermanniensis TaxID=249189 RepID=A0A1L8TRR1_9ENTE|nr:DUF441 domain-containing protein [Enterococcus hermanniensis]OJG47011.1 hypothetical protein RV04_GL000258 [Enterococcus hermanniensis]